MQALLKMLFSAAAAVLLSAGLWCSPVQAADEVAAAVVVVVAHANVPRVDAATLQRLYMGRTIEVAGAVVTVVNQSPQAEVRARFLAQVVGTDEDRYVSYWTVRRHVGKGAPPREFGSAAELLAYVQATPGAIGYVAAADLKPGVNVIYRTKP